MRKTRILCTLGPSTNEAETIGKLLDAGASAVRVNFSHGDHKTHAASIALVRQVSAERERMIPIVADLQGPKVRTGLLADGQPVLIEEGQEFHLLAEETVGSASAVSVDYPSLAKDVAVGDKILLADGAIALEVTAVDGSDVACKALNGGLLGERKGVNVPGAPMDLPPLTEKDKEDLKFALSQGVEYIAQSFVRRARDVRLTKNLIQWAGFETPVIAKIEKPQAIENLEEILEIADGVMIARGDLGVELDPWQVPIEQKRIIEAAARWRKPVITATQMLESMIENPRPTRAEVSDVANAVFDGSDTLMLSGETAVGKYPFDAVAMMAKIIETAESTAAKPKLDLGPAPREDDQVSVEVAHSAARLAESLSARYIVVFTESGFTAQLVSKHRPTCSILALSRRQDVCRRMKLLWGVRSRPVRDIVDLDQLLLTIESVLKGAEWAENGDLVVVVAGTPFGVGGRTNMIKLHRIGS